MAGIVRSLSPTARAVYCFALLLLLHVGHITLVATFAERQKLTPETVVPTAILTSLLLGAGVWGLLRLRRRRALLAIVVASFLLVGVIATLPILAALSGGGRWIVVIVLDAVYVVWAAITLITLLSVREVAT
ncbi:MAG: hypothetical protein PVJ57_06125 [Phycisphaerae bacterium]|jgi:hypothetical protein